MDDLLTQARRWADADPDPATRAEIEALLGAPGHGDLADRFAASLEFGTAGLRGVIGAGPNRMNRAVVLRATFGVGRHLAATGDARPVVIGYDGRHLSKRFAEDAACVLAAAGIKAHLFEGVAPTPLLAFAVTHLGCAAGIMVTASHNPPEYNGYKAYWSNGAQIVPPTDVAIAHAIEGAPAAREVPRADFAEARASGTIAMVAPEVTAAYLDGIAKLSVRDDGDRALSIVYTALHGVGDVVARQALANARFQKVASVAEQAIPDAAFPTVKFPNPEEKGAMDLAFALARKEKADLVVANDPDADRLAVAVPSDAGYTQLTGNQVGVLLGHWFLTRGLRRDRAQAGDLVMASIVSSPMLGVVAKALGAEYEETLTGFKWIANRAIVRERSGARFLFGYEEALGYTVGPLVRDKDGISAAVAFAELTAVLRADSKTVLAHLEALYRRYGLFLSSQVSVTRKGASGVAELKAIINRLRRAPPTKVGEAEVTRARDLLVGGDLPKSDVLVFELGDDRIIARPSGTEPKAKFYIDVREAIAAGESLASAEARATTKMKSLADAFALIAGISG